MLNFLDDLELYATKNSSRISLKIQGSVLLQNSKSSKFHKSRVSSISLTSGRVQLLRLRLSVISQSFATVCGEKAMLQLQQTRHLYNVINTISAFIVHTPPAHWFYSKDKSITSRRNQVSQQLNSAANKENLSVNKDRCYHCQITSAEKTTR